MESTSLSGPKAEENFLFGRQKTKIFDLHRLKDLRKMSGDQKIVLCHGVFDVLHAGHLAYFQSAKKFGDLLVVTVTGDQFVNKGPDDRILMNIFERRC